MTASRASTPASRRMWSNPSGSGFLVPKLSPPRTSKKYPSRESPERISRVIATPLFVSTAIR